MPSSSGFSLQRCTDGLVPKIGSRLDVKSFLSNNGKTTHLVRGSNAAADSSVVNLDVVLGKHLLICCVSLPLDVGYHYFSAMLDAYCGLSRDSFEMVLVATLDSYYSAFNDFFFSKMLPCLAVPFSDTDTRRYIFSFIPPLPPSSGCPKASGLLLDSMQTFVGYGRLSLFFLFGAECFPHIRPNFGAIKTQDELLRFRLDPLYKEKSIIPQAVMQDPLSGKPLSLHEDILMCPPDLPLTGPAVESSVTVSELSKKHVGLYLCFNGRFYKDLRSAHHQCIANGQELEILVIFIPVFIDPNTFFEKFSRDQPPPPWFVFPSDNKVWRRLWRVFNNLLDTDKFIILQPSGKSRELEGKAIIHQLGINEYPFMRSTILERRFTALKSLTPDSLFKGAVKERTCLVRRGKKGNVRKSEIVGKKLLVYVARRRLSDEQGKVCRLLMELYPKIRAMGWEVVCVPLECEVGGPRHVLVGKMPWPIMPVRAAVENCAIDKVILKEDFQFTPCHRLIGFGKDGKIVSRKLKKRLKSIGMSDSLFCDNLYEELANHLILLEDERHDE